MVRESPLCLIIGFRRVRVVLLVSSEGSNPVGPYPNDFSNPASKPNRNLT